MSPPRPTPEQQRAADPHQCVWVDANAGTGKTRVLADRVLRLLLDGAAPDSVLCLTFTRAAAAEMADRVRQRLAAWAALGDGPLGQELEALDGAPPTPGRLRLARGLFDRVLALPAGLAIMTVHGLCQHLLERFPLEAGVPPHFDVLDPRTQAELLATAREQVLAASRHDARRAQDVAHLVAGAADRTVLETLDAVIDDKLEWLAARSRYPNLDDALAALGRTLDVDPEGSLDALLDRAMTDDAVDRASLEAVAHELAGSGTKTRVDAAAAIRAWLALDPAGRRQDLDRYRRAVATLDTTAAPPRWRLNGNLFRGKSRADFAAAVAVLEAEIARLDALDLQVRARLLYDRTAALWRTADAVLDAFADAKWQRAALDFDDLLLRTVALLETPGAGSWVRWKLDRAFTHLLVDEAQDTNPLQWRIVAALADEVFAGEGTRPAGERTLFVVGDPKQSIYRFQGADPDATGLVRRRLEERARGAGMTIEAVALGTSFRSSQAILDVVDEVLAEPEVGAVLAGAAPHRAFRTTAAGRVEVWPLEPPSAQADARDPWAVPPEPTRDDRAERRHAQRLAERVAAWLQHGDRLPASGRPIRAEDVLVLVQRRAPLQEVLVRAFKRAGVPVAGADRLALRDELAVQDLVHLAAAVTMPEDDFALACALKSPLLELDEDRLFALAHGRAPGERLVERWRRAAASDRDLATLWDRFEGWQRLADFVPPYEWLLRVLGGEVGPAGAFEGRRAFVRRFGAEVVDVLDGFVEQALTYERGHAASLPGFLQWLDQGEAELRRETAGAEGVRVMTVHGAKGLEAPVVILADAGPRHDRPPDTLLWLERPALPLWRPAKAHGVAASARAAAAEAAARDADDLRLLYVALTRAAERLVVCGWEPRKAPDRTSWHARVTRALERRGARTEPDGSLVYTSGHPVPSGADTPAASPPPLPAVLREPVAPEPRPQRLTPAAGAAEALASTPDRADARAIGEHVHRLLEHLPLAASDVRDAALARYLASHGAEWPAPVREAVAAQVRRVLATPALAPLFGPGALAEQPLVGRIGDLEVRGRIDRLLVEPDRVWLADFKTGTPPAEGADPPAVHLRQLAAYRLLLQRIFPGRSIEAVLIWTASGAVSRVDAALLDAHVPDGVAIADAAAIA